MWKLIGQSYGLRGNSLRGVSQNLLGLLLSYLESKGWNRPGGCWSEKGICKALYAGCCCTRKKVRVPSKIMLCVAFGDWISPVLGCICCLLGWELKLWVSFVATLFFFFDLGLKYSCLVVWVDLYCSPFVWIKFSYSPKWKKT